MTRIPTRTLSGAVAAALVVSASLLGCDPPTNAVSTVAPPRDPSLAELQTTTLGASGIDAKTFVHDPNLRFSDRVYFGSWGGARATALVQFDLAESAVPDSGVIESAELRFNCVDGHGPVTGIEAVALQVAAGEMNGWTVEDPEWPGPDLVDATATITTIERCDDDPDSLRFAEVTLDLPPEMVADWFIDPADTTVNRGVALRTTTDAGILSLASIENLFTVDLGTSIFDLVSGPRLAVRVADDDSTYVTSAVTADAYAVAPDSADVPCADPADCLQVGRGVAWRSIFRFELPDLPRGSNVHRAELTLSPLGHERFDSDLNVQAFHLTSEWPEDAAVDSLVEIGNVVWVQEAVTADTDTVALSITDLVQAWYDGTLDNEGLLIRANQQDEGFTALSFAGPTHPTAALRPRLEVTYSVPYGGRP
jgi:hypothetical protein